MPSKAPEIVEDSTQQRNNDQFTRDILEIDSRWVIGKTAAPAVTDDVREGYDIGTKWVDETNDRVYELVDNSEGAAVWVNTGTGGASGALSARVFVGKTTAPTTGDDTNDGYLVGDFWVDETNDITYQCLDTTAANAVWKIVTGTGAAILG